jgi:CDP-diacylglycerol--glycerol-3-phosphate 3-phosphatidyltransferase
MSSRWLGSLCVRCSFSWRCRRRWEFASARSPFLWLPGSPISGYLARRYDQITDVGKLLDPIADKLLLVVTFIPFFIISHRGFETDLIPWWGPMPVWVLVVIFGREIFITLFRSYAVGRGVVIAAGKSGKQKTLLQALFIGGLLLWYPLRMLAESRMWDIDGLYGYWSALHTGWIGVTLVLALILTIYSMLDYLWSYRSLVGIRN